MFWLGTHKVQWLQETKVPLFISNQAVMRRKKLVPAIGPWALDSGGFTVLNKTGTWSMTPNAYVDLVRLYRSEIGNLQWAAPQDWMCEEIVLSKSGFSIPQHQALTVYNFETLRNIAPDLPFVPVVQGYTLDDYLRCLELYNKRGFDLTREKLVAVGTLCRRQHTTEATNILKTLHSLGLKTHAFGYKMRGLPLVKDFIKSSDSLAWSFTARYQPPLPGCVGHKNCANCLKYALLWRQRVLELIGEKEVTHPTLLKSLYLLKRYK